MSKFDYKNGNFDNWKSGTEIPAHLLTISATDAYKLLEALNIDWKNIPIPRAGDIKKWNSSGTPIHTEADGSRLKIVDEDTYNSEKQEAEDNFFNADTDPNSTKTNSVDWLSPSYDYLKDNGYIDDGYMPDWYADRTIHKSEDIIDIINYLIWRVTQIDYYVNNWDTRNTTTADYRWTWELEAGSNIDLNSLDVASFNMLLTPSTNRTATEYKNSAGKLPVFLSNSDGQVFISNKPSLNIISKFKVNNTNVDNGMPDFIVRKDSINYNVFTFHVTPFGTSDIYYTPQEYINNLKNNDYSSFDPNTTGEKTFLLTQRGGNQVNTATGDRIQIVETNSEQTYTISKGSKNAISGVTFNGQSVALKSRATISEAASIGDALYEASAEVSVHIPYKMNLPGQLNKYYIRYDITYGEDYGIYPYFYILNSSGTPVGETNYNSDNTFLSHTSDLGNIKKDSNGYYFEPCDEKKVDGESVNTKLTIGVVFYYPDTDKVRQLPPVFLKFNIQMNAEIKNKIIFTTPGQKIWAWENNNKKFQEIIWEKGSPIINANQTYTLENNITYSIVDIEALSNIGTTKSKLFNYGFIYSFCGVTYDQMKIEPIGLIYPSSFNASNPRTITLNNERELEGIFGKSTFEDVENDIYKDTINLIGGKDRNSEILYVPNDSPDNYTINEGIIEQLNSATSESLLDTWTGTNTIEEKKNIIVDKELDGLEYILLGDTDKNGVEQYIFSQSTALYPYLNGIINDEGTYYDADNDYYFLVVSVSAPPGTKSSISYSAAKGYLFIRIRRKIDYPQLSMRPISRNEIQYTIKGSGDTKYEYSMRNMVKKPIFLDRLFTDESQDILSQRFGKQFWTFNNVGASKWDDEVVARKNEKQGDSNYNEDFIKIYNDDESFPSAEVNIQSGKENVNTKTTYEGNVTVNLASTTSTPIGKFTNELTSENSGNLLHSGPMLFVNKLQRKVVNSANTDEILYYEPVLDNQVVMNLSFIIGNDNIYSRLPVPLIYAITVYKQVYDVDLMQFTANGTNIEAIFNPASSSTNAINLLYDSSSANFKYKTTGVKFNNSVSVPGEYNRLFFGSNEFGTGSSINAESNGDIVLLDLDNGKVKLNLSNTIKPIVELSGANDEKWVLDKQTNTVSETYTADEINALTSKLFVLYPTLYNTDTFNVATHGAIYFLPLESTGQRSAKVTFTIYHDDDGIYGDKEINVFFNVTTP